jgi:hypothetical protein
MLVFISHSRENSPIALGLCTELRKRRISTWLDMLDADPLRMKDDVAKAVEQADAFVFIIGPTGPSDSAQRFEWQTVLEQAADQDTDKPLIPIVLGDSELPGFLKLRRAIEIKAAPANFKKLASEVLDLLKKGDTIDSRKLEQAREARKLTLQRLGESAAAVDSKRERLNNSPLPSL